MAQEHRLPEDAEAPASSIGDTVANHHAQIGHIRQMEAKVEELKAREQSLMREFDEVSALRRKLGVEILETDNVAQKQQALLLERLRELFMANGMKHGDAEQKARSIVRGSEEVSPTFFNTPLTEQRERKALPRVLVPPEKKILVTTESSERIWKPHEEIRFSRLQRRLRDMEDMDEIPRDLLFMGDEHETPISRNILGFREAICRNLLPDTSKEAIGVICQLPGSTDYYDTRKFWNSNEKAALNRLRSLSRSAREEISQYSGVEMDAPEQILKEDMRWSISRDLREIAELDRDAFEESGIWPVWGEEEYIAETRKKNAIRMVVDYKNEIIAHILYELYKNHILLRRIVVRSDMRHRGVAESMIRRLNGKLDKQRRTSILMDLPLSDTASMQFLAACGLAALPEFIREGDESLATMQLDKKSIPFHKAQSQRQWLELADQFLTQVA